MRLPHLAIIAMFAFAATAPVSAEDNILRLKCSLAGKSYFFDKTSKDLSESKTLSIDMTAGSATDDDKNLYRATISDHLIQLAMQLVRPGIVITGVHSIDRSTFSISFSGFANGEVKGQTINTFDSATGSCQVLKK